MTWCLPIETIAAHNGMPVTVAHGPGRFEMYAGVARLCLLEQGQGGAQ